MRACAASDTGPTRWSKRCTACRSRSASSTVTPSSTWPARYACRRAGCTGWRPSTPTSRSHRRAIHTCVVCMGTACYINGATKLLDGILDELGIDAGQTTSDGQISVLTAHCVGACSVAPVVVIDGEVHGKLSAESASTRCAACDGRPGSSRTPGAPPRTPLATHGVIPHGAVRASANVCEAAGCLSLGADRIVDALTDHVVQRGLTDVAVRRVGCLGLCARGPLVDIPEHGRLFEEREPGIGRHRGRRMLRNRTDEPRRTAGLLRPPSEGGARELRSHRPREPRRLPRQRRLRALTTALTSMKPG